MRTPSLSTRSRELPDGRLASEYDHNGESIWVCDSAQDALATFALFERTDMVPAEKSAIIYRSLFPCIQCVGRTQEYLAGLLTHILWEAFALDITPDKEHSGEFDAPVFDFDEDAPRIKSSLLAYYGLDWNKDGRRISYTDLCSLLSQLSEADMETVPGCLPNFTTSFAQAIYYRTAKPPKASKGTREQRKAFLAMRQSLALGAKKKRSSVEAANDVMAETFAAARRNA